jgi:SAM-dependent methyltransferase
MSDNLSEQVLAAAAHVARDWVESTYYSDAERATAAFWDNTKEFRRLFDQMPLGTCLDLACGHGRHSEKLLGLGRSVISMDVVPENVAITTERLRGYPNFTAYQCNGVDFQPVPDHSVDAIICYDAMVHFDCDVVRSYIHDAKRILRPGGMALFHHSNYDGNPAAVHYGANPHARNFMTARMFAHFVHKEGCVIVEQQIFTWGDMPELGCTSAWGDVPGLDCISLFRV